MTNVMERVHSFLQADTFSAGSRNYVILNFFIFAGKKITSRPPLPPPPPPPQTFFLRLFIHKPSKHKQNLCKGLYERRFIYIIFITLRTMTTNEKLERFVHEGYSPSYCLNNE